MSGFSEAIALAIAGLLIHASWRLAAVATKLDTLCDRLDKCEANTKEDVRRLHDRVDAVEAKYHANASQARARA